MSFYLRAGGACFLYTHCQALPAPPFRFRRCAASVFAGPLSSGQVPIRRGASGKVLFRHGAGRHPAVVSKHTPPRNYPHSYARFRVTYSLQDGLLYHKPSEGKLCIPKSLRSDVIREAHDAILGGGHVGIEKTTAAVSARYHWPRMKDSIVEWVSGCNVCHRVKHKNARPYGLLQALPVPSGRAERVNIDFITKLPASEDGYDAVATIIDPLTKRACWIPVRECELTAEKFAKAFISG